MNSLVHRDAEGNGLSSESYTYNAVNDMVSKVVDGVTTTYDSDSVSQLIEEDRTGYNATYTYDANGNRTSRTVNSSTESYAYDAADKLLSAGSKTYDYDDAGRTTEVTSGGVTTYLAYDYEGRVTSITKSGVTTNSFAYNGLDTRVSKTDSAGTKTYRRAGAYVTDPVLGDGSANFTPGISERRSSTTTYLHSALKNADVQTGNFASVTGSRRYDAFGNVVSSSGTWQGPFGYAGGFGYQEDGDFGLKLLGHRYYDSSTGRFLTRDPAKDGRNWYVYCWHGPVIRADPTGNIAITLGGDVSAALGLEGTLGGGMVFTSQGFGLSGSAGVGIPFPAADPPGGKVALTIDWGEEPALGAGTSTTSQIAMRVYRFNIAFLMDKNQSLTGISVGVGAKSTVILESPVCLSYSRVATASYITPYPNTSSAVDAVNKYEVGLESHLKRIYGVPSMK